MIGKKTFPRKTQIFQQFFAASVGIPAQRNLSVLTAATLTVPVHNLPWSLRISRYVSLLFFENTIKHLLNQGIKNDMTYPPQSLSSQ